jgi:hypothetical protein
MLRGFRKNTELKAAGKLGLKLKRGRAARSASGCAFSYQQAANLYPSGPSKSKATLDFAQLANRLGFGVAHFDQLRETPENRRSNTPLLREIHETIGS